MRRYKQRVIDKQRHEIIDNLSCTERDMGNNVKTKAKSVRTEVYDNR